MSNGHSIQVLLVSMALFSCENNAASHNIMAVLTWVIKAGRRFGVQPQKDATCLIPLHST